MPSRFALLIGLLIVMFSPPYVFSQTDDAQEDENYDQRIKALEEENRQLRRMLEQMQQRLEALETGETNESNSVPSSQTAPEPSPPPQPEADEEIKKQLEEHSEAIKDLEDEVKSDWLPSLGGEEFRLGGRLQTGFFNPGSGNPFASTRADRPGGSVFLDEFRIYLDADFANNIRFYSSFDIEEDETGLVEAYTAFEDLPLNSEVSVGLKNRFYRPSRFTETYPLPGLAFWRRRDLGVTWEGNYNPFTAYISFTNGLELDDDNLGKDDSNFILGEDDDNDVDINDNKEFSGGLEFDWDTGHYGELTLLGFGVTGELSEDDIDFLLRNVPNFPFSFNNTKERFGLNVDYKIGEWDFKGQFITGQDGAMDREGWYAEASYKFEFDNVNYIQDIRPLIRYSELNVKNIAPSPFGALASLGWDRQQLLLALITEITDNVNINTEFQFNDEDTGGQSVNNNELLLLLEVRF